MNVSANTLLSLQSLAKQQQGVLTTRDLEVLFQTSDRQLLKNRLRPYLEEKVLLRFCRGFYVAPGATSQEIYLAALSQRISPRSIISLGTVLSRARLIGTSPKNVIYAVKSGPTRKYENKEIGTVIHFGFGGYNKGSPFDLGCIWDNGICYAEPERALLDTLYFYQRGGKFFFNIFSDMSVGLIRQKKYLEYLKAYPNSRFRTFARSFLDEKNRS